MFDVKDTDLFDLEEDDFDTVMYEDLSFTGQMKFAKPLMIKGRVSGTIEATSDLVVDFGAVVKAQISAARVLVRGKVEGDINAKTLIFVTKGGSIEGNIVSEQVVLEQGSLFSGRCTMTKANP